MSFGVGVADIFETLHFAKVTYDSWKEAPERYRAIESRLPTLRSILQRLVTHYHNTKRHGSRSPQRDLRASLDSIEDTLNQLAQILERRSRLKFWDRLRLDSHQVNDLSAALDRHIQDLTCLCSALGLESARHLRRGQEQLQSGQQALKRGQDELLRLVGQPFPSERLLPPSKPVLNLTTPYFAATHPGREEFAVARRISGRKVIAEEVITSSKQPSYQTTTARQRTQRRQAQAPTQPIELHSSVTRTTASQPQSYLEPLFFPEGSNHDHHHASIHSPLDFFARLRLSEASPPRAAVQEWRSRGRSEPAFADDDDEDDDDSFFCERRYRHRHRRRHHSFYNEIEMEAQSHTQVKLVHLVEASGNRYCY